MEGIIQVQLPPSKRRKTPGIDHNLCLLCQISNGEPLVQESKSCKKLFDTLVTRQQYNDLQFEHLCVAGALQDTDIEFSQQNYRWHLSCYKRCTHKLHLEALRVRHEKDMDTSNAPECSTASQRILDIPVTRSRGSHLERTCVF